MDDALILDHREEADGEGEHADAGERGPLQRFPQDPLLFHRDSLHVCADPPDLAFLHDGLGCYLVAEPMTQEIRASDTKKKHLFIDSVISRYAGQFASLKD